MRLTFTSLHGIIRFFMNTLISLAFDCCCLFICSRSFDFKWCKNDYSNQYNSFLFDCLWIRDSKHDWKKTESLGGLNGSKRVDWLRLRQFPSSGWETKLPIATISRLHNSSELIHEISTYHLTCNLMDGVFKPLDKAWATLMRGGCVHVWHILQIIITIIGGIELNRVPQYWMPLYRSQKWTENRKKAIKWDSFAVLIVLAVSVFVVVFFHIIFICLA